MKEKKISIIDVETDCSENDWSCPIWTPYLPALPQACVGFILLYESTVWVSYCPFNLERCRASYSSIRNCATLLTEEEEEDVSRAFWFCLSQQIWAMHATCHMGRNYRIVTQGRHPVGDSIQVQEGRGWFSSVQVQAKEGFSFVCTFSDLYASMILCHLYPAGLVDLGVTTIYSLDTDDERTCCC